MSRTNRWYLKNTEMILIYSEVISPRINYITKLIFNQILRVEIELTTSSADFLKSENPKINYSQKKFGDEIYLKPHGLLSQSNLGKVVA